jgi:acetoacetate decarboxylase
LPAIESDGTDSLDELVTMSGYDGAVGRSFTGTFDISLFDSPTEELSRLAPKELIAGYWREVATSWRAGTTLERHLPPSVDQA